MGRSSTTQDPSGDSMLHDKSDPGARFGRNVPLESVFPDEPKLLHPNPRVISQKLLARKEFIPAESLNLIAAAWIQFQTHDWFNHGEPQMPSPFEIPLPAGDPWNGRMQVRRTRPDPTRDYTKEMADNGGKLAHPPTYVNAETHWWDASQIYGSNEVATKFLRANRTPVGALDGTLVPDGKLFLQADGNPLGTSPITGAGDANLYSGAGYGTLSITGQHDKQNTDANNITGHGNHEYFYGNIASIGGNAPNNGWFALFGQFFNAFARGMGKRQKKIDALLEKLKKHRKPKKNAERDARIVTLDAAGKTSGEIVNALRAEYPGINSGQIRAVLARERAKKAHGS